jgi:methylenetetrahydrofolate--tRNA-(uracil-5-)-methyltransferase
MSDKPPVWIVGAGLAGCEAALQLAERGIAVRLFEMKPEKRTPAQVSDHYAELVCSNSFRGAGLDSAVGVIKEEMRRMGGRLMQFADAAKVPAGGALAVDREVFSAAVTEAVKRQPNIEIINREITSLPGTGEVEELVIATGPLTSPELAKSLETLCGGRERLYFYDAIAPIVSAESIDMEIVFRASRYGKGDGDDYLNCPMDRATYEKFIDAVIAAEKVGSHDFEEEKYFEGCLPIEVMAERGRDVLAHGPMKPVGLTDPRTGKMPHAVVQLRMEDRAGTAYNMVGFQTRLSWPEQKRIFTAHIPGLRGAEFLRMGQIHRNTFIDSPRLLAPDLSLRAEPRVFFAGQITGVEGYVESAACGFLAARFVHARLAGTVAEPPPATTAMGALYRHVTGEAHPDGHDHQPSNVIFGLFPPLPGKVK